MSEEVCVYPSETGEILENGAKDDSKLVLRPKTPIENVGDPAEEVDAQEDLLPIPPYPIEEHGKIIGFVGDNMNTEDTIPSENQPSPLEASIDKKLFEKSGDVNQPGEKPASDAVAEIESVDRSSDGNQPSMESAASGKLPEIECSEGSKDVDQSAAKSAEIGPSDSGLKTVTENIQQIYEGMKGMKISTEETPGPPSAKKGRNPLQIPRARNTPVKPLTSPPLTRSRSRDLRKLPSTPASPNRAAAIKNGDSESDELKRVRGRQRVKKN